MQKCFLGNFKKKSNSNTAIFVEMQESAQEMTNITVVFWGYNDQCGLKKDCKELPMELLIEQTDFHFTFQQNYPSGCCWVILEASQ